MYVRIADLKDKIFDLDPQGRRARMSRVANLIVFEWTKLARELNTTRSAYVQSIQIAAVTETHCVVQLPGNKSQGKDAMLAKIIEFGMGAGGIGTYSSYDVRKFLLTKENPNTSPIKSGPSGPYRRVNFDYDKAQAGSILGASDPGGVFSQIANARTSHGEKVSALSTSKEGRTIWGARVPASRGQKLRPHHVSTQAAGMVQFAAKSGSKGGGSATSRFSTFRTASYANTDPQAWRSKGVEPRRYGADVAGRISEILSQAGII